MEIKMALDAPSEASIVAQGGVFAQSRSELGKFSEVFCIQPHPVCVGGKESKECCWAEQEFEWDPAVGH